MKKILVLATAFTMVFGASKAAEKEMDTKANSNATTAATATNMSQVMQENQLLKLALQTANDEKEEMANKADYSRSMYFATASLYEMQLQKQQEEADAKASYAWMMYNVILNLNALNAAK